MHNENLHVLIKCDMWERSMKLNDGGYFLFIFLGDFLKHYDQSENSPIKYM